MTALLLLAAALSSAATYRKVADLPGLTAHAVRFSADGRRLAVAGWKTDGYHYVGQYAVGAWQAPALLPRMASRAEYLIPAPDGSSVFADCGALVRLQGRAKASVLRPAGAAGVALGGLKDREAVCFQPGFPVPAPTGDGGLALSPDGRLLVETGVAVPRRTDKYTSHVDPRDGRSFVFDARTGALTAGLLPSQARGAPAFNRDGSLLATVQTSFAPATLELWSAKTRPWKLLRQSEADGAQPAAPASFSPDGRWLAAAGRVYGLPNVLPVLDLGRRNGLFDPAGAYLLAWGNAAPGKIAVLGAGSWRTIEELDLGPRAYIASVDVSPDGRWLAAAVVDEKSREKNPRVTIFERAR